MTSSPNITSQSWLMVAVLGFVWGGTFLVTEIALTGMTPFWLAASRIGFAALVMLAVWGWRGWTLFEARPTGSQKITTIFVAIGTSALPFSLLAWGQQYVTAGFAGVSMASVALIVLPMAHVLVPGEQMTVRKVLGFMIGFAGVVVLMGGQAFDSTGSALETPGRLACIAAAACYASSSIMLKRLPEADPIGLATVLLLIGAVAVIPLAYVMEGPPAIPNAYILGVVAFLGLVPTAAANFLRVLVVRTAGPVFMSLVNYMVPLWSVIMGALVLSEPVPPSLLWAMLLILVGVGLSQFGAFKRLFRAASRHQD